MDKLITLGNLDTFKNELEAQYKEDCYKFDPVAGTSSYSQSAIADALAVDLNQWDGDLNRVGYVYNGYTSSLPSNCNHGIREVYYYNSTSVFIKIIGRNTEGYTSEWINEYNGSTWTGWREEALTIHHIGIRCRNQQIMDASNTYDTSSCFVHFLCFAARTSTFTSLSDFIGYIVLHWGNYKWMPISGVMSAQYGVSVVSRCSKEDNYFIINGHLVSNIDAETYMKFAADDSSKVAFYDNVERL